jgi:putative proteasome-type protease
MTYCVAVRLKEGLVFVSDSRTNAGVDQISTYSKMYTFGADGERQLVLLCAGNLATTQAVVGRLKRDIQESSLTNLMTVQNMDAAADYVGEVSLAQQQKPAGTNTNFEASFVLGGQIGKQKMRIVLIYPQGNYITSSRDTPYLQIGESKYGKPILDRIIADDTTLETAVLCALVSMDSTMRSNLTVGPPIEVLVYRRDSLLLADRVRLEDDSEYLRELKRSWDRKLKEAFHGLPPIAWASAWDRSSDEQSAAS